MSLKWAQWVLLPSSQIPNPNTHTLQSQTQTPPPTYQPRPLKYNDPFFHPRSREEEILMKQYKPDTYAQEQQNKRERRDREVLKLVIYVIALVVVIGIGAGIWQGVKISVRRYWELEGGGGHKWDRNNDHDSTLGIEKLSWKLLHALGGGQSF